VSGAHPAPTSSDTIVAIATPPGAGAIGVIRVSGPAAIDVVAPLARLHGGRDLKSARARVLERVRLVDPEDETATLDDALVAVMPAPASYTGEDVVEVSCHGNPALLAEIVRLIVHEGARLAGPGEFTRRAYLNGRIDLVQAEAVALLIEARSDRAVRLAARQLGGGLSDAVLSRRNATVELIASLEVALDFPDDEIGPSAGSAIDAARRLVANLDGTLEAVRRGRTAHDGLTAVLAGAPNVGKSSLLNKLLRTERAIVSPIPGTTRDTVEGPLSVDGVPVTLVDGAGLGVARDAIDAEGMRRAAAAVAASDLVVVVLDRSRPLDTADAQVLALTAERERLLVANKSDLLADPAAGAMPVDVECSALTGTGIDTLRERLQTWARARVGADADEGALVASVRAVDHLERALAAARGAEAALRGGRPLEVALVDLRTLLATLDAILGRDADDAVLDRIFATFCVGK
jgi:tRNA modification GTPase